MSDRKREQKHSPSAARSVRTGRSAVATTAVAAACAALLVVAGMALPALADAPPAASGAVLGPPEPLAPPEPLSPWHGLDQDVATLVVRGELPLEAVSFRPVDRGRFAAWLAAASPAGPSAERVAAYFGDELRRRQLHSRLGSHSSSPTPSQSSTPSPPDPTGSWLRIADRQQAAVITPYLRVMPTLREGAKPYWSDSSRVGFHMIYYAGENVVLKTGFFAAEVIGRRRFADALIAGTDFILHADEITVSARLGSARLRLGRDRHHWGPGVSGSLLLSEAAEPLNFVEYQLRLGSRFRFLAITGVSDRHTAQTNTADEEVLANPARQRYVAAHRLLWNITDRFTLGLSEGARYQSDGPNVLYLTGILPYTLVERLDQQDETSRETEDFLRNNVLWYVDAAWRPGRDWMLYGELLADDIATESSEKPNRGGYLLGARHAPRWRGWDWLWSAEYARVANYVYSVYYQELCQCDWEHQDAPLGYAWGPDVELWTVRGSVSPTPRWRATLWVTGVRKGAGAIGSAWFPEGSGCDPDANPDCGDVDAWELSAPVHRTTTVGAKLRLHLHPLVWGGGSVAWRRTEVRGNGSEADEGDRWIARLELSVGR